MANPDGSGVTRGERIARNLWDLSTPAFQPLNWYRRNRHRRWPGAVLRTLHAEPGIIDPQIPNDVPTRHSAFLVRPDSIYLELKNNRSISKLRVWTLRYCRALEHRRESFFFLLCFAGQEPWIEMVGFNWIIFTHCRTGGRRRPRGASQHHARVVSSALQGLFHGG